MLRSVVLVATAALLFASTAFAAEPVNPTNTFWTGPAGIKAKIPGAGSPSGPVDLQVLFGPNGGAGLDANEFHLIADDGMEQFDVFGTWTVDAKGQPVLAIDTVLLADELSDLMVHVCADVLMLDPGDCAFIGTLDVLVDADKLKLKVKTSTGTSAGSVLQFSGKIPFVLTDGIDQAKLAISLKTDPAAELSK